VDGLRRKVDAVHALNASCAEFEKSGMLEAAGQAVRSAQQCQEEVEEGSSLVVKLERKAEKAFGSSRELEAFIRYAFEHI
jgi:hypothetical protein